ncbi:lytic transglycosylase domain-containing protein [Erwinia tracheiphila]|uniref:Transglycosylase SLT domain-containing protein n=1 Tax=Erwinia tracheiphila TaxID=65700 RepID=A0A0M2KDJ6_9GAMM|nr:lytic transglycosylase domain-containing protein [Erwinia tracheiphila]EOS94704.1 hypothetical protein ETR_12038 [Erwinia tracheiphila PSU-1]KKF37014.1 hypothetical protein SY86_18800 [Erwinia tracheiphila]UIA88363.1 lytic transglycosylase domain-containing protein [Erwinia tracheiphila]UIA96216.1 lytic transglycosylase domain-containing protein [Erwinia tracheiphila]
MIIEELAYKVTVRADEFMSGKKKVEEGAKDLGKNVTDSMDVTADSTKKAGTAVDKVGKQLKRTSEDTKRPFGLLSSGFFGMAKGAKAFGKHGKEAFSGVQAGAAKFLGLALSIEGTRRLFTSATNSLVDLGNASSNLGLDPKVVDGYKNAAESVGSSSEAITSALTKMKNAKNWSTSGIGAPDESTVATLQLGTQTGVDILGAKDADEMFRRTEEALRKLPKEQAQIWMQRVGIDASLLPSILDGSLDKNQAQFQKKSSSSDEAIKQAREVKTIMQDLDVAISGVGSSLVLAFGPDITKGMKDFSSWIDQNKSNIIGFFKDGSEWAKKFSEAVGGKGNALNLLLALKNPTLAAGVFAARQASELSDTVTQHDGTSSFWESLMGRIKAGGWYNYEQQLKDKRGEDNGPVQHGQSLNVGSFSMDRLLDAVAKAESAGRGDINAVSPRGATGRYQFMPDTAREMGLRVDSEVDERRDPVKSREAARKYLNMLINRYHGNVDLALKAYNVGFGSLDKWINSGARPQDLNKETKEYVGRVSENYGADLSRISALGQMPAGAQTTDNSQTSTTHIGTVQVNTNPQSVDAITKSIAEQQRRSSMGGSFVSGNG